MFTEHWIRGLFAEFQNKKYEKSSNQSIEYRAVKKHPNKECEREWIDFVRQIRKNNRRDNDQV